VLGEKHILSGSYDSTVKVRHTILARRLIGSSGRTTSRS
jgi:hypothetical protein